MSRAKNILYVDLSEDRIETEPVAKYARDFVGGGGVGVKLMFDRVSPDVRGLDPENMITFNAGTLTGTLMGNKCDVITKSPKITNSPLVSASFGGQFPSEMKFVKFRSVTVRVNVVPGDITSSQSTIINIFDPVDVISIDSGTVPLLSE